MSYTALSGQLQISLISLSLHGVFRGFPVASFKSPSEVPWPTYLVIVINWDSFSSVVNTVSGDKNQSRSLLPVL